MPALTDTAYMSVILFGSVERVEDPEEMRDALQAMLDKYVPGYYDRPLSEAKRFSPGRTHKMDV